jgi:SAM-dependent methyltransferase
MIVPYPQKEFARALLRILHVNKVPAGSRIFDIPCGNGEVANCLAKPGHWKIEGYDLSISSIALAKNKYRKSNLQFFDGDIHQVLRLQKEISAICIVNSFFLLERRDELIESAYRSLTKGGVLALIVPNISGFNYRSFIKSNPGVNKIEAGATDLQSMLRNSGFESVASVGICFAPLYGRAFVRYFSVFAPLYLRLENILRSTFSIGSPSYFLLTGTKP